MLTDELFNFLLIAGITLVEVFISTMLGAYIDAKLMKSDGEVSDRYFTQRKDNTFYLAEDTKDDIMLKANYQEDFYTYEIAFPLKTGDQQDVPFEIGKAYNFLLLVGNTLEHHGIFTLDEARFFAKKIMFWISLLDRSYQKIFNFMINISDVIINAFFEDFYPIKSVRSLNNNVRSFSSGAKSDV